MNSSQAPEVHWPVSAEYSPAGEDVADVAAEPSLTLVDWGL